MREQTRSRSVERKPSKRMLRRAPSQSGGVKTKYDEEENCELSGLQRLRRYTSNPFLFSRGADSRRKAEADRKELEVLGESFSNYAYIRFAFSDINGVHRSKLIPARHARSMLNRGGTGIYSGIIACGPLTEEYIPKRVEDNNFPNALLRPMPGTLNPVPWASKTYKTGQVLCETFWMDGTEQAAHPRTMARRQLARLDDMGYSLLSAFETELMMLYNESRKPVFPTPDYCCTLSFRPFEDFFMEFDQQLQEAGVDIETIHAEHAPGQFETILRPSYGISSADQAFILKHALKEAAEERGINANYMAKPIPEHAGNGTHFNFSLWDKRSGKNVFFGKDKEDGLSEVARWWIGGLVKHSNALCALMNPTVNCYRRLHEPWAPDYNDWNIDDRMVSYRIKNYSPTATYFENRVSSALSNPYVVLAATVAAGLDGITNHTEPPAKGRGGSHRLPDTLGEALNALQQDTDLCEGLGQEFVDWFVGSKREVDMKVLKASDPKVHGVEQLNAEFAEYARLV